MEFSANAEGSRGEFPARVLGKTGSDETPKFFETTPEERLA